MEWRDVVVDVTGVFKESIDFYKSNFKALIKVMAGITAVTTLVVGGVVGSLYLWFKWLLNQDPSDVMMLIKYDGLFSFLIFVLGSIFMYFLLKVIIALYIYVDSIYSGDKLKFLEAFKETQGKKLRYFSYTILFGIINIIIGMVIYKILGWEIVLSNASSGIFGVGSLVTILLMPFYGLVPMIVSIRQLDVGSLAYNIELAKGKYLQLVMFFIVINLITLITMVPDIFINMDDVTLITSLIALGVQVLLGMILRPFLFAAQIIMLYRLEDGIQKKDVV